jgi:T1SS-143 domain-containing protein
MATQIGVITAVVGTVTATAEDGSIRTLQAGDRVYANEVISTGPAGAVEIEFADGSVMDLGRDSQAMLDTAVFDPDATGLAETDGEDVPDDVAAIQQAILEGEDPTEAGEATAAGAGAGGGNEGHDAVFVNYLNPEVTPDAGFDTVGVNSTVDDIEDEQLIDGVPTAGLVTVLLDEDDLSFRSDEEVAQAINDFLDSIQAEFLGDTGFNLSDFPNAGVGDEGQPGDDLPSPNPTFFSGTLNADFGLNGPGSISFNPVVSQPAGLTSGGEPVQIWVSADGLTLIGYIAGEGEFSPEFAIQQEGPEFSGAEIIFSAQIDPATLNFTAGIYGPLDHADTAEEGAFEENLLINMAFTITDADGDAAQGIIQLNVDDDSPVIGEQDYPQEQGEYSDFPFQMGVVDEDDTDDGVGNTDSPGDDSSTPYITLPINFGADGPAAENPVEISAEGIVDQSGNPLTSNGVEVQFSWNSSTNTLEGTADGQPVINIHVDVYDYGAGSYTEAKIELFDNLDHPIGAEGESLGTEDNLGITLNYTATDADGDQAYGSFDLSIDDDMPVIGTPEAVSVDEEGIDGNAGDSYDADATVNGVLLMPELENGDLNSALDTDAKQAIKSFVEAGGQLVINGSSGSNDETLLNDIFGFSITNGSNTSSNVPTFSQTGAATGTDYESGPAQLNNPNGTYTWDISSLPAEATVMYSDGDDAAVVTIPVGDGQITFLAYDWYNAAPTGSQDGGWTDILDIAVSANGSPAEVSVFDNGSYVDTTSGGTSAESDNVQDTLQSQGHNVSTFTGITLADILAALPEFTTGDLAGEDTVASGSLAINWGADNNNDDASEFDRSVVFTQQDAPEGLTADGEPVSYSISEDGTMLTAFTGEAGTDSYTEVFTVTLSDAGNGSYEFTLLGNLDHPEANTEDDIDLNFGFMATDSDGDAATGSFTVTVDDDAPVASGETVEFTVDEDDINTALSDGNQSNDGNSDGSFTGSPLNPFDNGPANVTGSVASLVSFGADGAGTFTLTDNFDALLAQNLTSKGEDLSFSVDGNVLTAEADGREVFTLTLQDNGEFTFELSDQLDHADANGENNLPVDLSSVIVATDADGDAITLDSGFVINVTDDVPEQAGFLPEIGIVEDEALPNGNQEIFDSSYTITLPFIGTVTIPLDVWPDTAVATGSLADQVSVGSDEPASFELSGDYTSLIAQNLTSGGEPLTFALDGDTLYAVAGQTPVFTLTVETNGDYTFTLMGPIDHTEGEGENLLSIDFSGVINVEDFDGDTLTLDQDFYIKVVDDSPEVGEQLIATVDDEGLIDGIEGGPEDDVTQGADETTFDGSLNFSVGADQPATVDFAAMDGDTASVGTETVTYSWNSVTNTLTATGPRGPLFTVEVTDTESGDYTVTLLDNVLHESLDGVAGDNTENNASVDLEFTVTDNDGDSQTGSLTVDFDDDTPVVTSQQINLLTESFEDFAPDLSGNNWTVVGEGGGTIIGNNGIEWTVNGAGIEIQSGNVGGASASDGDVHAELDAHDSNSDGGSTLTQLSTEVDLPTSEATLSFDFQPRPSDVDGSDMSVSLGGQTVDINVDGSGVIDFGTLPSGVTASQSTGAGGWTTITLTFTGLDTSSAQTLSFEGQGSANTLGAYIDNISLNAVASLTVDESALADGSGEAGASTTASFDFSGFFSGAFGADGPADTGSESYSLNLNGEDVASGLFTVDNSDTDAGDGDGFGQGVEIVLNQVDGDIVGSAGGVDYFTISVNAETGEVTLTQHENIWHADTTNPDDSQGMVLDSDLLTLVKTITDADEDSAEATLDLGGVSFNFEDDAPAIEAQQPAQPYLLTVTNEGGDAGYNNTYGFYIKGEDGEPVSGEIIWANVKNNTSEEINVEVTDPSDIGFFIIPDGADLNDLSNGDAVTFQKDGEGNWEVLLGGEPLSGQGTNVLFDNADLNPDNAEAVEDNAASGNQNWEDIIGGDNDFNDVNINVSINQLGAITVDETDIGNGDPSNATAALDLSGSFTADFGADGEGDVDYGLSVNTDVETGLVDTLSGEDVELRVNGDGDVEGFITTGGSDEVVFTVSVDEDGVVTLTQLRAVEHDDVTDPDEANSPATLNAGAIALTGTVTDADGDSADASIDVGVLFAFEDDGPVAADDTDTVVEGSADGNVVTADSTEGESGVDSYGADGPGNVTSVTFGETTEEVPAGGSVEIEGDYGTLTMNSDGSYTYTTDPDSLPQNTETVEGWANTGSNMTAFNLGESFLTADGKYSDTGSGSVTTGGNAPGFGVGGTSAPNTNVPEQINYSGSESEALAFKFDGTVTSATVQFSNMFQNENGGEAMRWHAFDADGNRIGSGIVSDNENASDPYANSTDVTFDNNNIGSFTLSDIGAFSTLVFEGVPYSDDGSAGSDDSDFFVNVTSYEVFNSEDNAYQDEFGYTIVDGDGDSASATLTLNGNSEPQEGQLEPAAPVAADNTYQVDGVTTGNIITDDDDNGGAASGRDYDNDTPVINLSINSVIFDGDETFITEDNTEIELDNGTLVINLDGSYTYTPAQDADGGDEFEYTLIDPDGEISEPATVTLLETQIVDVITLDDVSVNEGDGTATITGSVENPVTGTPLVITLDNGATITIPVGDSSAVSTPFPVQGDDPYIDAENYTVEVTGTTGGNYSSLDISDDATVTISDTIDTTTVTLDDVNVAEDGTITYSASVDNAPQGNLTITLTNGVVITIPDGATTGSSAPQAAQGDDVYVDGESFNVGIQSTSGGNYEQLDTTDTAAVTISDTTDTVTATLSTATTDVSEDGGDIIYTVTLTGGPGAVDPDADLVIDLANGEQVTILAGQTSGSVTATYTDADITNQTTITNSISGVVSGGTEYENLQTAGSTSVDVDYGPVIEDLTPQAQGGDLSVDEDDLTDGSDTSKESTTQEGTFTISAADGIDDLTIGGEAVITDGVFTATSFTTALGNTLSVTDFDAGTGEITYTYELTDNTLTHGPANNGENNVFENFDVVLSDVDGDLADDVLSVQIIDDVPTAVVDNVQAEEGSSETLGADLVLMIDTSASVSSSDLSSMKTSLQNLFNSGSVHSVFITSFAEGSEFHDSGANGGWYTNLGDAMTAINGLSSSGTGSFGTDYDAALEAVTDNFTAPPAGGGELVSMFISDGEPNETNGTGSYGIIGSEESAWIDFLEANGFDNSFAVGYNGLDSTDIAFLEPIAWTEGEGSSTHTGSDDDNVIILDNVEDLADTLTSTVTATPTPVTGNVLANDDAGADGYGSSALVDVTYDGNTVTFSGSTTSATFDTVAGELVINSDGSYEFTGLSDTNTDVSAVINYTIQDADGDQSSSNLVVSTQDSVPVAENDVDDVDEANWSIDGTESASVTLEGWSDTAQTENVSVNDSIDPSEEFFLPFPPFIFGGPDSNNTNEFEITADSAHEASVSVDVNVRGYNSSDVIQVSLFKDGQSEAIETVTVSGNNNFSQTVNFSGLVDSGDYYIRLYGDDNSGSRNLRASLSDLKVSAFDFGQNTYTTTVNTAALAALAAATGNVLANDDAGADGGLSVTEVNGDAVSGSTNIDGLYGTLTIDENGDYTYTPNAEDLPAGMSDSFTYTVTDADGSEDTATLTIDINDHNYVVDDNDNVAVADAAGGSVNAQDGDDVLIGSDQADTLNGGAGNDNLMGNDGDDTLIGGAGNDILTGGDGADIFQWNAGDEGTAGSPAVDFVTDFSSAEGDSLNLADLLQGEESNDITNYISVAQSGSDVVIEVTPDGAGGDMNQVITLQDTTVDQLAGGIDTSGMSQADIINTLITNGQLNVDPS